MAEKEKTSLPFDEADALLQVQSEFMQSYAFMNPKQMSWIEYLRAYYDGRIQDKVKINLWFANINALQALESMDRLKIKFVWWNHLDFERSKNWDKLAEDAYNKMGMTLLDIEWGTNKFLYWVKIKLLDVDADWEVITNIFDTRLRFPDPSWCYHAERFRFMGFRKFMTKDEMKEMWFSNLSEFTRLKWDDILERNPYLWFSQTREMGTNLEMNLYAVYMHMTVIKKKKYIIYTNDKMNAIGLVVRCSDIIPALKKQTLWLKWELRPVELDYWRPQYDNPTGISVMDLSYDKQIHLSQLVNLQMKRAVRVSLWWHKLYNTNAVKNRQDLAKLWVDPVFVWVDLPNGASLQNVVYEQPIAAQMPNENFNAQDTLQYQNRLWLWFDANQLWVWSDWDQTATETNVIQANSNVIQWFGTVINIELEKRFWLKWYLIEKKNIKWKKIITVINSLWEKALEFWKDDLMMSEINNVIIKSTNEVNLQNKQELQWLQMILPFVQSLWWYSYRKLLRDITERITGDNDRALEYVFYSNDELQAMKDVRLLNNWQPLSPVADIMWEDHIAYIIRYQQAKESEAKQIAIMNRMEAQRQKEKALQSPTQDLQNMQQNWWLQSQMAWAMVNQWMQQWSGNGKPIATNQW